MVGFSRGVFGIYWAISILYVLASRFLTKAILLHASGLSSTGRVRVAIYGAGWAGIQLASALRVMHNYHPVAFIDRKNELQRATIGGVKVYSSGQLPELIKKENSLKYCLQRRLSPWLDKKLFWISLSH
jgi:FlaA1/EpsC-like NDP-sugar epimerase